MWLLTAKVSYRRGAYATAWHAKLARLRWHASLMYVISTKDVMRILKVKRKQANYYIKALQEEGFLKLKYIDEDKARYYNVKGKHAIRLPNQGGVTSRKKT